LAYKIGRYNFNHAQIYPKNLQDETRYLKLYSTKFGKGKKAQSGVELEGLEDRLK
jgi:hypothetical protein